MHILSVAEARAVLDMFDAWNAGLRILRTTPAIVTSAATLVRRFDLKLRLPDAVHLSFCVSEGVTLVTNDQQLQSAASTVGVVWMGAGTV